MSTTTSSVNTGEPTPLDVFLADQGCLTPVAQFARRHEGDLIDPASRYYRDLVPLSAPKPGQQYGFEVDLDACTGCKACVIACNNLNGLDEGESFRATGLLHGGTLVLPLQQTVTTACHHCVEPACMNGCPTRAFDKDPLTGIVSHAEERCLGCGYCTWTCPYEVPRFNEARGVIRKCDMCKDRLAVGEAPACVQACPNGAIAIRLVDIGEVVAEAAAPNAAVLPTAPPSMLTIPTTRYLTAWEIPPDVIAADYRTVRPGHGHRPLVVMLVLTQMAVGTLGIGLLIPGRRSSVVALLVAMAGLVASVAHLGQPQRLWRSMAGLRTSWLSREVAALGAFTGATVVATISGSRMLIAVSA
ncbi:MAG: DmsC/YnfH family molybdoenzyme membrane anchor subunit, partial [Pseudonocardiaceae bacterium]